LSIFECKYKDYIREIALNFFKKKMIIRETQEIKKPLGLARVFE